MKSKKAGTIVTFLGYGSKIEGTIEFQGTIHLDGEVKGKIISTDGTVRVGDRAVLNADIVVGNAMVKGEVNGTIEAKEKIEIFAPGKVIGDIKAPVIVIDTGAVFNGKCGMKKNADSSPKNKKNKKI